MSFNEWYGASSSDNLAVITTSNTSVTTTGKFGSTTYFYGYQSPNGYYLSSSLGSSSNNDFNVNGNTFDILATISTSGAILDNNILQISGNYGGLTLAQISGFRYLKNGSNVIFDSTHMDYNSAAETGDYNSTNNTTTFYYYILSGTAGYAQGRTMPNSATTMNLYFSN